jgi:hypothetical protein
MTYILTNQSNTEPFNYKPPPYKNFMVFVSMDYEKSGVKLRDGDTDYSKMEKTLNIIRAQIDNSIECGWAPNDIIIATNFHFEYRGVKTHILDEICEYSQFFNKQYATLEMMQKGVFEGQNVWYHDLDAFQLTKFDFPYFNGDWGTCVYPNGDGHSCQCGIIYLKHSSQDMFEHLVHNMKLRNYGTHDDEVVIRNDIKLNKNFSHRVNVLNTSYNLGMTGFRYRYQSADKPIKVVHFHPDDERQWNTMVEGKNELGVIVVNKRLLKILNKHKLC